VAAENHLASWIQRNTESQVELKERLTEASLSCDPLATVQVAKWVYQQTEKANGQVWVAKKEMMHLSSNWAQCFGNLASKSRAVLGDMRSPDRQGDDYLSSG
jgi:hypothetical protein